MDEPLTREEVAKILKLYRRDGSGELNVKRVYDLPIPKTHYEGVGVRWRRSHVEAYMRRQENRSLCRDVA